MPRARCSRKFFLGDQDSGSGLLIRRKLSGDGKAAGPNKNPAARQHRPTVAIPTRDALSVQQAFQLVGVTMAPWAKHISWTPAPQHQRSRKRVAIQDRPGNTSFSPLKGPVNDR